MIYGISGKRGSGKDTVIGMIQLILKRMQPDYDIAKENQSPDPAQIIRFAQKSKLITSIVTGYPIEDMYSEEGKKTFMPAWGMTIGEAQQKIAEAICDNFDEAAFAKPAFIGLDPKFDYIVCDIRKPVEVLHTHLAGGVVLRLEGNPVGLQGDGTRDDNHISEIALDDYPFEYVIHNDGTKEELFNKVLQFVNVVLNHN